MVHDTPSATETQLTLKNYHYHEKLDENRDTIFSGGNIDTDTLE